MDLDLNSLGASVRYKILTALVIPRPIAWVTSLDEHGRVNAAPFSFFNVLGNKPPLVAFAPGDRPDGAPKDTARNVRLTGEFVVNLVDREAAEVMHATSAPFPPDVSEVEALGLETLPSTRVRPPRLRSSKIHLECKHWGTLEIGGNRVVFGLVEHMHVPDGMLDPTTYHVQPGAFEGVGRLQGPGWYCTSADRFDLGRFPSPAELGERRVQPGDPGTK
jgi:flavin reductase (DIM6/NTAB) family NADH-FMN oxidoreductase RutF